ncbi:PLP-dependent transferase [Hyaloscypha bicolor E]|uniref:PLP-dependent transferase n=1 Tax=Hyaloscypha bicolor E TaxID=1095630 RepID=A0A2J6SWV0_9HELO|nr:PLP-dependent transferase [Hyaloscypha bicolor E]PMD55260.1 PLP-dependent transferase [Hyaloscypha bicolor E]
MAHSTLSSKMTSLLSARKANSAFRTLTVSPPTSKDFSSNDFLSLSTSPVLRTAYLSELTSHPDFRLGSSGSRLLDGNSLYAETLEKEIAEFHGAEAALLFNSGFDANEGLFACVPQRGDVVVYDAFIHASVHEGMRLSRAGRKVMFEHNSVPDLERVLSELARDEEVRDGERNVFVAVESLYSMDGDLCPLKEIVELVERMLPNGNGHIIVDEAHSNGIYGSQGRGVVCSLGLEDRIFARLHTFGKAIGCNGAAILCSPLTRAYLINYARPLIYTTAMSFPSLAAIKVVYGLMKDGTTVPLIWHLNSLITHMYEQLLTLQPLTTDSALLRLPQSLPNSPIFALLTPEPRSLAKWCQAAGFVVRPIVPPTVPEGTQRVRVCLHAGNSKQEVEALVASIRAWLIARRRAESAEGIVESLDVKARL